MVQPSGADLALVSYPTPPVAPARFTTTTGLPQFSLILLARMRAMTSLPLPGPISNPTLVFLMAWYNRPHQILY